MCLFKCLILRVLTASKPKILAYNQKRLSGLLGCSCGVPVKGQHVVQTLCRHLGLALLCRLCRLLRWTRGGVLGGQLMRVRVVVLRWERGIHVGRASKKRRRWRKGEIKWRWGILRMKRRSGDGR